MQLAVYNRVFTLLVDNGLCVLYIVNVNDALTSSEIMTLLDLVEGDNMPRAKATLANLEVLEARGLVRRVNKREWAATEEGLAVYALHA